MSEHLKKNTEQAIVPPRDPIQLELDIGRASLKPPITAPGLTEEEDRDLDRYMDHGETPLDARIKVLSQREVRGDPLTPVEPIREVNPNPSKTRRHGRNKDGTTDARTLSIASRSKL